MLNKCLKCGEPGHQSSDCPKTNLNLVEAEGGKVEVNNNMDGDGKKGLELEVDDREMNCIVQKILLAPKFEEDNQHNKIFRTRYTINNKMCNMIINSGNSENVIRLSTEKHPTLYKIRWTKKRQKYK